MKFIMQYRKPPTYILLWIQISYFNRICRAELLQCNRYGRLTFYVQSINPRHQMGLLFYTFISPNLILLLIKAIVETIRPTSQHAESNIR